MVGDSEMEAREEQGPAGLTGVEEFSISKILNILVVGCDGEDAHSSQ